VLEFGCNAGRNLVLLRDKLPAAALTGVDVNPEAIRLGKEIYELDLTLADEDWLTRQSDDAFDVSLTISVVDHMPYPETVLRHLLRVTKHYLVLFELVHDRIGKTTHNLYLDDAQATLKPAYRYSYTHDYRYECERKFGAHCLLDAKFPIGPDNLLDLYRLFVFSKRRDFRERSVIRSVRMTPIDD
jgi:SAM-dependent methyltransferase